MATYSQLMTAIIQRQMSIMGNSIALKIARQVPGIEVTESGNVVKGASKGTLSDLLEQYKALAGPISLIFAKKAIEPLLDGKEDLPAELRSAPTLPE